MPEPGSPEAFEIGSTPQRTVRDDGHVHEHLDLLRREFEADEGTFLLGLRGESPEWNKAAFSCLERAMRWTCEHFQDHDQLDRWLAEGFYYVSWFIRDWTAHPGFTRPEPQQYYSDCIQRIGDLADWFFHGTNDYVEPHNWPDLLAGRFPLSETGLVRP